jgi:hypothetical protein
MMEESNSGDRDSQGNEERNNILFDNPTFVITLLYFYVTANGIVYSASLYARFGVNVFDYSETADFLLAALKNPISFLSAGLLATIGAAVGTFMARHARRKTQRAMAEIAKLQAAFEEVKGRDEQRAEELRDQIVRLQMDIEAELARGFFRRLFGLRPSGSAGAEKGQAMQMVIIAIIVAFFSLLIPYYFATRTASSIKHGELPTVDVRYRSFTGSAGQVTAPGLELIGATQKAAFFYDGNNKRTIVIPQAQLVSIEVPQHKQHAQNQ